MGILAEIPAHVWDRVQNDRFSGRAQRGLCKGNAECQGRGSGGAGEPWAGKGRSYKRAASRPLAHGLALRYGVGDERSTDVRVPRMVWKWPGYVQM